MSGKEKSLLEKFTKSIIKVARTMAINIAIYFMEMASELGLMLNVKSAMKKIEIFDKGKS